MLCLWDCLKGGKLIEMRRDFPGTWIPYGTHLREFTDVFAKNPIGVEVSFESLLEKYRNGVELKTLLIQPEGPPAPIPAAILAND